MPLLFSSEQQKEASTQGFIVAERPTAYGPGVIVLITLLGLAFVVYALLYSFRSQVHSDTELLLRQISDLDRSRNKSLETEIFIFERRVSALSRVLRSHHLFSQLIPAVEEVTLPTVFYDGMSASLGKAATAPVSSAPQVDIVEVQLQGTAPTLLEFARQMIAYREDKRIVKGGAESFSFREDGTIEFTASLLFDRNIVLPQEP